MSDWRELQAHCYPWQHDLWQQWHQLWQAERWHHALLLVSDAGHGAPELVAYLAQALLCQQQRLQSCGSCHSCHLFQAKNHPDVHWIAPTEGKHIGIDALREANHWALETAQLGGQRVIVIEGADRLGEGAANALLKTLEEPPENCQFVLLAESLHRVLPTILSRCSHWRLSPMAESELLVWGQSQGLEANRERLRLCHHAPLLWAQFDADAQAAHQSLITQFCQYLEAPEQRDWQALAQRMAEHVPQSLDWLSYLLLDAQKWQRGAGRYIVHCQHQEEVARLALLPWTLLLSQQRALHQLKYQLSQPLGLNQALLLGDWLMAFIPA